LAGAAAIGAGVLSELGCVGTTDTHRASTTAGKIDGVQKSPLSATGEKLNSLKDISNYNNYYEFSTDKYEPAETGEKFSRHGLDRDGRWSGEEKEDLGYDQFLKLAAPEERIYRHRCVEVGRWSCLGLVFRSAL